MKGLDGTNTLKGPDWCFMVLGYFWCHTTYFKIMKGSWESLSVYSISNLVVFVQGFVFSQITWSKMFKGVFIPSIKKKLRSSKNFNISASKSHLDRLYDELVRYEMLRLEQTTREDFLYALTNNWNAHESKIHFEPRLPKCQRVLWVLHDIFSKQLNDLKGLLWDLQYYPKTGWQTLQLFRHKERADTHPCFQAEWGSTGCFSSFQNQ